MSKPYYALDFGYNVTEESYPYAYAGKVYDENGHLLGIRFACIDENCDDYIDVPKEMLGVESPESVEHIEIQPVVHFRNWDGRALSPAIETGKIVSDQQFFVNSDWEMDGYLTIHYPNIVYHIKKDPDFDYHSFVDFVDVVNDIIYGRDFIPTLGVQSIGRFSIYEFRPYIYVKGVTLLDEIGYSDSEISQIFYDWCKKNKVDSSFINFKCEGGVFDIIFHYSAEKIEGLSLSKEMPSVGSKSDPLFLTLPNLPDGDFTWERDNYGLYWMCGDSYFPDSVSGKKFVQGEGELKVNEASSAAFMNGVWGLGFGGYFMGYSKTKQGSLIRETAVRPSISKEYFAQISQAYRAIRKSSYIQAVEKGHWLNFYTRDGRIEAVEHVFMDPEEFEGHWKEFETCLKNEIEDKMRVLKSCDPKFRVVYSISFSITHKEIFIVLGIL